MFKVKWLIGHIVLDFGVVVTNIYEQFLMTQRRTSLDTMDHFLLSLSVSDLVCGLAFLTLDIFTLVVISSPSIDFTNHLIADRVWDSFCMFSVLASALHVTTIAVDRICAMGFQKKYKLFTSFKYKCIVMCTVWTITLATTILLSVLTIYTNDIYKGLSLRADVLAVLTVVVVVTYTALLILYCVRRERVEQSRVDDLNLHYKVLKPYTLISLLLGVNFVVCVSPITYSYFRPLVFHPIGDVMFTLKSILNPWIYFTKILFKSRYFNRILPHSNMMSRDQRLMTSQRRDNTNIVMTMGDDLNGNNNGSRDNNHRSDERAMLM